MTFREIVTKRKEYAGFEAGFINASRIENGRYDNLEIIDPWNLWHGSPTADILVVGQDWGSTEYYTENQGMDSDTNPTCLNLSILFRELGINIGTPSHPSNSSELFFTNIIPAIRTGKMSGNDTKITVRMIKKYASLFLKPLIECLKPKIIITLGKMPLIGVSDILDLGNFTNEPLKKIVESPPIQVNDELIVAPMFHCGSLGLANRGLVDQQRDWANLNTHIEQMKNKIRPSEKFNLDRNVNARRLLEEIAQIIIRLQEIYTIEAVLNDLRLSFDGKKYYEEWRSIRSVGNQLRERLKSLTAQV